MIRKIGWQDIEGLFIGTESADEPLVLGEGIWVLSDSTQWTIQGAGEIYNQTVPIILNDENGFKLCANPCPRALKLSETFIAGYTTDDFQDDAFPGYVVAQKLDKWGAAVCDGDNNPINWYWADWFEESEEVPGTMIRKTGWQDIEGLFIGVESADEDLALGEAVWVLSDSTQWQFVFPKTIED